MRKVINISLPYELTKIVDTHVKSGEYATKSEFFRHLLRLWSEGQLLENLNESRQELITGRGKILKSLKDLR